MTSPSAQSIPFHESLISEAQLNECDRIDLNFLGNIQGETANVLFISYPECQIRAVDAHVLQVPFVLHMTQDKPTVSIEDVLNRPAPEFFPEDIWSKVDSTIQEMIRNACMREFIFLKAADGSYYTLSVSTTALDHSLISIEIETVDDTTVGDTFHSTLVFLSRALDFYANGEDAAKVACDTIFKLLGKFDRGMVYRFNDDLSGESARLLYVKNILRYIKDVNGEDVSILSLDDEKIDLTQTRSRCVHKSHLLYLKNMGVVSSMSIAIIRQGELWGLFSFHGYKTPFMPTLHQRVACETIASCVSARIDSLAKKIQTNKLVRLGQLFKKWRPTAHYRDNLEALGDQILDVCQADVLMGRFIVPESETRTKVWSTIKGDVALVPGGGFWEKMSQLPHKDMYVTSTRESIAELGLNESDCPVSGFCYFQDKKGDVQIMVGRSYRGRDLHWGGNPDAPKLNINGILHPRASFEAQVVKSKLESRPFTPNDLKLIELLRDRIFQEHSNGLMLSLLENDIGEANQICFNALERTEDNNDFLAHMCHELRTPFHGVMGCLNILHDAIDEMSSAEIKEMIRTSIETGNHMVHLLNDILTQSKNRYISASKARDNVLYHEFATGAVKGMRQLAANSQVHFHCCVSRRNEGGGRFSRIVLDRTKVTQIITNITNNAVKFAGPGGRVEVNFQLETSIHSAVKNFEELALSYEGSAFMLKDSMYADVDEVKQRVQEICAREDKMLFCFSVSDSGVGMKKGELVKMFDPYTQSNNGRSRTSVKGTGLGLFICVELCRRLDAFIACSSTPNRGTVFHVGIPVEHPVVGLDIVSHEPACEVGDEMIISGPILLVDDNSLNIKIIERQLLIQFKRRGIDIEILKAGGGRQAISLYKKRFPSLLLVDYHMPDIDGIETMSTIRKMEAEQQVRPSYMISYTADATDNAARLLLGAGGNEIMLKPPPKDFLPNLVSRLRVETRTRVLDRFT